MWGYVVSSVDLFLDLRLGVCSGFMFEVLPLGVVLSDVGVLFDVVRGGSCACFLLPNFAHVGVGRFVVFCR